MTSNTIFIVAFSGGVKSISTHNILKFAYVSKGLGGSRKWLILLTFSTVFMLIRWVGGVQKGQKYADVI